MPVNQIYLTIDDSPSIHMHKKVDFLSKHQIPAIFYCRGEFIEKHKDQIIYAIEKGFLIGNHSYTHPYFSEISFEEIIKEVEQTETLIDNCYKEANLLRPHKIIRLPFGDRGAGSRPKIAHTSEEKDKVQKIQQLLKNKGFATVNFGQTQTDYIDAYWDWDTQDYKSKFIAHPEEYQEKLIAYYNCPSKSNPIMILHDFDSNHHLFEITMDFLLNLSVSFLNYQVN